MTLRITALGALAAALLAAQAAVAGAAPSPNQSPSSGYQGFGSTAASPAAPASGPATPTSADAAIAARAKEWLGRLQKGDIDRSQFTADMNAALTAPAIDSTRDHFGPLGIPKSFELVTKNALGGVTGYVYRVTWADGAADFTFALDDASGKIAGLFLRPAAPQ